MILLSPLFHKFQFSSAQFSRSVMSDSLWPHELQHARPPYTSPTPGVHPNSCPSSRWCHPAISSSVIPFSSCPQSLPASESFPMSQLFTWGGQSSGVSALASFLPKNIQGWSPLEWIGSPCNPRDSQESSPTPQFKSINSSALSFRHPQILLIFSLYQLSTYPIISIVTIVTTYLSQSYRIAPGLWHFQSLQLQTIQAYHRRIRVSNALVLSLHDVQPSVVSHCCLSRVQAQLAVQSHEFPHSCLDLDHALLWSSPPWLLALTSLTLILPLDFLLLPLNHYLLKDCSSTNSVSPPFFNGHVTSCLHCVPTLHHGDLFSSALSLHLR